MIQLEGLTKRFGETVAVDGLDLEVQPGRVTGFLGPNGAGKSTTMRMILGLDRPSAGRALVAGVPYHELDEPLRRVGALLEADAVHPGRSGRNHLRAIARSNGIPLGRVEEVLEEVGIAAVARRRVGTYSLGMRQRLGIAGALLGDPEVLIFDEPVNGLDPDGVRWVRELFRQLARDGRTVLVSSHLMSEMQQTADHLLVIGRGRLLADAPMAEIIGANGQQAVRVLTPLPDALASELIAAGALAERVGERGLLVTGLSAERIGDLAFDVGAPLHELHAPNSTLEQAYMELTTSSVEYAAPSPTGAGPVEPGTTPAGAVPAVPASTVADQEVRR